MANGFVLPNGRRLQSDASGYALPRCCGNEVSLLRPASSTTSHLTKIYRGRGDEA